MIERGISNRVNQLISQVQITV